MKSIIMQRATHCSVLQFNCIPTNWKGSIDVTIQQCSTYRSKPTNKLVPSHPLMAGRSIVHSLPYHLLHLSFLLWLQGELCVVVQGCVCKWGELSQSVWQAVPFCSSSQFAWTSLLLRLFLGLRTIKHSSSSSRVGLAWTWSGKGRWNGSYCVMTICTGICWRPKQQAWRERTKHGPPVHGLPKWITQMDYPWKSFERRKPTVRSTPHNCSYHTLRVCFGNVPYMRSVSFTP